MPEDISQPVIRYHQEVVNARKLDILDELFTPDFINEATGFPPIIGVQAMREVVQSILEGFPDCQSTIEDIMANELPRSKLRGIKTQNPETSEQL